jgi:AAA family ATP:ADP antiporter
MATSEAAIPALPEGRSSRLDRIFGSIAGLHPGEANTALLLATNVFLLLGTYYLLKTVREALILTEGGAAVKSYSSAGQAVLMLAVVPIYGRIASAVSRVRLITIVTLFFASNLVLFALAGFAGMRIGIAFFLWLGVFNMMIISQLWSYANDLYTEDQGKRVFPIIGLGSSLGAVLGAQIAGSLFEDMDPYQVMLIAAVLLAASLGVTFLVNQQRCTVCPINRTVEKKPISGKGGFQLVFSDRYLLLIAGLTLLLNLVNTTGEFILGEFVVQEANLLPAGERSQFVGAFYGNYFWWVNVIGVALQLLVTPRLLKRFGAQGALFILPIIALGGYSLLVTVPTIALIKMVKIFENATDYSIQNTAKQALFLATSREAKYKAKTAIDTFFVRLGDMAQAGLVAGGLALGFGAGGFALVNLAFVAVWFLLVILIFFEYRKRMASSAATETPPI